MPMRLHRLACILALLAATNPATAQPAGEFDYFDANRRMIRNGVQAVLMCNGLFTSQRTPEQVFTQELAYLKEPVGTANGGDYEINRKLQAVSVGGGESGPAIRAAFREGIGCVVMAPDQDVRDIPSLPEHRLPPPPGDPATTIEVRANPHVIDADKLDRMINMVHEVLHVGAGPPRVELTHAALHLRALFIGEIAERGTARAVRHTSAGRSVAGLVGDHE